MPSALIEIDVGAVRDRDAGLHLVAVDVDELAGAVALERAVAGVGGAAVGQLDGEEAFAADRDVEVLLGRRRRCPGS